MLTFSAPLAGIFGLGVPELVVVLTILCFPVFVCLIVAIALYSKHRQQQLWHETARLALEKGQPLPPPPPRGVGHSHSNHERNDLRAGIILIAVSAGIFVFFRAVNATEAAYLAAIPCFIGVALVLLAVLNALSPKGKSTRDDTPTSS